ncbi:flippase [Blastococcus capsensis]|uniref:flippase n=1 Tax=Blastococcus capsensis TaxID=1564163 RepID=UPI0025402EFF|nr:flippase [Blastococcus capsensis]MDK3257095.1 flippase [Blastococcus capsensis]
MSAELLDDGPRNSRPAAKGVVSNSQWQLLSFVFRAVAGVGVVVLLARAGGPRALGVVQFALTLTSLLPFYYGVPSLLAREVARRAEDGRRWVEAGTLLAVLFGGAFAVLLPAGAWAVGTSGTIVVSIAIAAAGMTLDGIARVQFAAFWAWERMDVEAKITGLQETAYLAGAAAALALGGGPLWVLGVFAGSRAVGALVGWLLVGRHLGGLPLPRVARGGLRPMVRQCTPFAISDTLTLTYARFDAVMLGVFKGPVAVGLYQAATNLVLYFNVLARSINRALYPRMGRAWPGDKDGFRRLRDVSLRAIAFIGIPIAAASLLLAPRTIDFLYGPEFLPAVLTYQLLVTVIPVRMLGNTFSLSLAATDNQTPRTIAVAVAAGLNVALNLYFIPRFSYLGAAMTTVICETGLLVAYAVLLRRAAGRSELLRSQLWPVVGTLPMAAVILLTREQHVLVSAAAGIVAYALAVAAVALVKASGDRRRPARVLAALVRPAR